MTTHFCFSGCCATSNQGGIFNPQKPPPERLIKAKRLTLFVQEELVKAQAAGLLPDEAVHVLRAVVVNGDGVLQRLHAGLQTEGDLGVSDGVSAKKKKTHRGLNSNMSKQLPRQKLKEEMEIKERPQATHNVWGQTDKRVKSSVQC